MPSAVSTAPLEPKAAAAREGGNETPNELNPAAVAIKAPRKRKRTKGAHHQSRSAPPALTGNSNVVELRRTSFLCAWSCVVGFHIVCAVYLTQFARVCLFLVQPYMAYWAQLAASDRCGYFWSAVVVLGTMGALHWWQLVCILWVSLRARELMLLDSAFKVPIPHEISHQVFQQLNNKGLSSRRILPSAISVERLSGTVDARA